MKFPELKFLDTTELDKAVEQATTYAEMTKALWRDMQIQALCDAVDTNPPEADPNEPDDYESKTHGY
jgi:hypothetical protein